MSRGYLLGIMVAAGVAVACEGALAQQTSAPAPAAAKSADDWYPLGPNGEKRAGVVVVKVCFLRGANTDVSVAQSSGFAELDEAAVRDTRKPEWLAHVKHDPPKEGIPIWCKQYKTTFAPKPAPQADSPKEPT